MKRLAVSFLAVAATYAAQYTTGQAARAIVGQKIFTDQNPASSNTVLGGVSGLAYTNNTLIVADSNRAGAPPINNRVLIFHNVLGANISPTAEVPQTTLANARCPICSSAADVVLGQTDFFQTGFVQPPTNASLRNATGVATDGKILVVSDSDNNRLLIWKSIPTSINVPADIVVGQPDFASTTANNGTGDPLVPAANTLRGPAGVFILNGKLLVADSQNHRVLIWRQIPTQNFQPADVVLGQPNFTSAVQPDLTKIQASVQADRLLNPVSVSSEGKHLFVSDLGHNRVLIWNSIPDTNAVAADVVVGQATLNDEWQLGTNSSPLCASNGVDSNNNPTYPDRCDKTMDFPRDAISDGTRLYIADGGNNRILIYNQIPTANGTAADVVLGQYDFTSDQNSDANNASARSSSDSMLAPSGLAWDPVNLNLFVADPYNRRVMVFSPAVASLPVTGVRNAASLEIFADASLAVTGTITENDQITLTVKANSTDTGIAYVYKIKKTDTLPIVIEQLVNLINAGAGNPNVIATANLTIGALHLTARVGGDPGNNVSVAVTLSTSATITLPASTTLSGGHSAAKIAPGTLVSLLGNGFTNTTVTAPAGANPLPTELGGVQVYFDGYRAPLSMVSPTQINAQVPVEVYDTTSITCWVRTSHTDGSVIVTNAEAVPIVTSNPGIFALTGGADPRPGIAYHSSSQSMGTVAVDGTAHASDVATITIQGRSYSYTVQNGDSLATIRDALIALINQSDPEVYAYPAGVFQRVRLHARVVGPEGNSIRYSASTTSGANVILTPAGTNLCCANQGLAPITTQNPAIPGETIVVYATGLGLVTQIDGNPIGLATGTNYQGTALNTPYQFMNALAGGKTADVLLSALKPGEVGTYEVHLQLNPDLPTNPLTEVWIAQDVYVSNIVTIPLVNPTQ